MPRKRKSTEKSENILLAALHQLSEKGFSETTMDDIAKRAGVAKGTLYLYYPSKESLLMAIAEKTVQTLHLRTQDLYRDPKISFRDKLEELCKPIFEGDGKSDLARALRLIWLEGARRPELVKFFFEKFFVPVVTDKESLVYMALHKNPAVPQAIKDYPYLLMAPLTQAVVWTGIGNAGEYVDFQAAFKAYLDMIFPGNVKNEEKTEIS